jgi:hypothetical protein
LGSVRRSEILADSSDMASDAGVGGSSVDAEQAYPSARAVLSQYL